MNPFLSTLVAGELAKSLGGVTGKLPILNTGIAAVAARLAARSLPMTLAVAGAGLALTYFLRKPSTPHKAAARAGSKRPAAKSAKSAKSAGNSKQRRVTAAA